MVARKVYDYKTGRTLAAPIFLLIWGTGFFIAGIYAFFAGPVKDSSGAVWSPTNGIPYALLGLIALIGGCLSFFRAMKEKIVIEDENLIYFDWRGRQKMQCHLRDCHLGNEDRLWQPWLGVASGMRNTLIGYPLETPAGSFTITEAIRDKDELLQLLARATKP